MKLYIKKDYDKSTESSGTFARDCIYDFLNIDKSSVVLDFIYNKHSKPYLNFPNAPFFSLSHSGNMIICAVGYAECGADCQIKSGNTEKCEKIARRFFTPDENCYLYHSSSFTDDFYKIWTRKEAYIKFTGKGLSEGLNSFSTVHNNKFALEIGNAIFLDINVPFPDYEISACIDKQFTAEQPHENLDLSCHFI